MPVSTRRLAVATLLTGVIADLAGLAYTHLLHWIQAITWDMHGGTSLKAVNTVSPTRCVEVLTLAGVVSTPPRFLLFCRNTAVISVSGAVGGTPMSPLRATWHALTQILIVGLGASVGCKVIPCEMATAFSAAAAGRLGLTPEDRRIIVACGAGTGLTTVYSTSLSGTVYTLEILLVSLSMCAATPTLIISGVATLVSTRFVRSALFYTVLTSTPSLPLTVFDVSIGPVLSVAGWALEEAAARTDAIRPRDRCILITLPLAFVVAGLVSIRTPLVLGNGQVGTRTQSNAVWTAGVGLMFALLILSTKAATASLAIDTGGWGGALTPAVALDVGLGVVTGLPWAVVWPESEITTSVFIGAAAFLSTSMKAPLTGFILAIEFIDQGVMVLVPTTLAVDGTTTAATRLSHCTSVDRSAR